MENSIASVMTPCPHTIGRAQTLFVAHKMMIDNDIRHLPVLDGGRLVGVASERDLFLLESFDGIDPRTARVEEAMMPEPFVTSPSAPVGEVCRLMAKHKYGCAIVEDHGKVVGIFTAIDALRILSEEVNRQRAASSQRPPAAIGA